MWTYVNAHSYTNTHTHTHMAELVAEFEQLEDGDLDGSAPDVTVSVCVVLVSSD